MINHPSIHKHNPKANIHSVDELLRVNRSVEELIVDSNACNDKCFTLLKLSSLTNLKVFEVGDYSFAHVEEVKLSRLNQLERVVIGMHCFSRIAGENGTGHFYLKKCKRVKELKIGYSFFRYGVCVIEDVDRLEVIKMGELKKDSHNFFVASLELKSMSQRIQ